MAETIPGGPGASPPANAAKAGGTQERKVAVTDEVTLTPPALEAVRRATACLSKASRMSRLYPAESDIRRRFTDELFHALTEALTHVPSVRLQIGRGQLTCGKTIVLATDDPEAPVPGRLYWDGLRELSFHEGLTIRELREFLQTICDREQNCEGGQDDLATLLWSRRSSYITHVALDDLLNATEGLDFSKIPDEFLGEGNFELVDLEMRHAVDSAQIQKAGAAFAERLSADIRENDKTLVFKVTEEEIEKLRGELAEEERPERRQADMNRLLREILFAGDTGPAVVDLLRVTVASVDEHLEFGDIRSALDLVLMMRDLQQRHSALPAEAVADLNKVLDLQVSPAAAAGVARSLDEQGGDASALLPMLLEATSPASLPFYCEVLGLLETAVARRRLIGLLVTKGREHPKLLEPFLADPRWYLVRNVALILGEIGNPDAIGSLRSAMRHRDARVRKEVARAVSQMGSEKAYDLLVHVLHDADPALRRFAVRELGAAGEIGFEPLRQVLNSAEFENRALQERMELYEAFAYAGRADAVDFLRDQLQQKVLWMPKHPEPVRASLCQALGIAGGDKARRILESHRNDRSGLVRKAARAALERLEQEPGGPMQGPEAIG
jgi:HEAT repeat protein